MPCILISGQVVQKRMDIFQISQDIFPLFIIREIRVGGSEKLQFTGEKSQWITQLMRKSGKQDLKLFCILCRIDVFSHNLSPHVKCSIAN